MQIWLGECHVHAGIRQKRSTSGALRPPMPSCSIHPECGCSSQCVWAKSNGAIDDNGTHVLSTEGMLKHAQRSAKDTFLIAPRLAYCIG